ncbi:MULTISPECIES: hypothetical protein [Herbaspirillum]|uniref:Uncharacterized protein n=2 Tax=Herbaspirillum huttiense TaxID=863372 RepID=A0AAJ2LVT8_9BURK|nr:MULTISPECIES: hypothetical protein [Herbaspirillum]MDR9836853.1 hypothetical protein [Herbaspirillum huttiense]
MSVENRLLPLCAGLLLGGGGFSVAAMMTAYGFLHVLAPMATFFNMALPEFVTKIDAGYWGAMGAIAGMACAGIMFLAVRMRDRK